MGSRFTRPITLQVGEPAGDEMAAVPRTRRLGESTSLPPPERKLSSTVASPDPGATGATAKEMKVVTRSELSPRLFGTSRGAQGAMSLRWGAPVAAWPTEILYRRRSPAGPRPAEVPTSTPLPGWTPNRAFTHGVI